MRMVMAGALCALLAGCGGAGGGNANGSVEAASGGTTGGWDETDPCKTLDKAVVAKVTGQSVVSATLVNSEGRSSNHPAATGQCDYALADGRTVTFSTRISDIQSNDTAIPSYPQEAAAVGLPPMEPVAGIGRAAFWTAGKMPHLDVFVGENQYASILLTAKSVDGFRLAPDPAWARSVAEALAKEVAD